MSKFFSALIQSWQFVASTTIFLISNFSIAIYPLLSVLISLQLTFTFVYPLFGEVFNENDPGTERRIKAIIVLLIFYIVINLVTIFGNAFLIYALNNKLDSKLSSYEKTNSLKIVLKVFFPLIVYSLILSFLEWIYMNVRLFINFLLGLIVFPILGAKILGRPQKQSFQLLLLMSLPIIILEGVDFKSSIARAGSLLSNTWGEKLRRKHSQGLLLLLTIMPVVIILVGKNLNTGITTQNELLIIQAGKILLPITLLSSNFSLAIDSIYGLAAYRYATRGYSDVYENPDISSNAFLSMQSK